MKETAVIIVNWNGEKYIEDCLRSFEAQTYTNFDLFFVDNDSSDDSLSMAKKFEWLKIIESGGNLGFAGGNNLAINKAIKEKYKYIALINPDTVLEKNTIEMMVKKIKSSDNIGAVQPLILIHDTKLINTAGNDVHFLGFSYCGTYKKPKNTEKIAKKIVAASGAGVIFKTDVLKKVGLLDEDFFMYLEDTDLSWRILEAGYEIWLEPKSILWHKYNFSRNKNKFYYIERNRLFFILKNYQLHTILLLLPIILVTEILMLIYSLLGGWFGLKIKGYGDIIRSFRKIRIKRKEVFNYKKLKDRELKRNWKTDLKFDEVKNPLFLPLNLFFRVYWFIFSIFI